MMRDPFWYIVGAVVAALVIAFSLTSEQYELKRKACEARGGTYIRNLCVKELT